MTRKEAIALGLKTYNTGKPCKHHPDKIEEGCERYTIEGDCVEYKKEYDQTPKRKEYQKEYRKNNKEEIAAYFDAYVDAHLDEYAARKARRDANKEGATPENQTCAERDAIEAIYAEARNLTETTGINHEVDHIMPISKGGLHVAENLRPLKKKDNRKKHATITPEAEQLHKSLLEKYGPRLPSKYWEINPTDNPNPVTSCDETIR